MDEAKLLGLIGLAGRMRAVACGEDACRQAIKAGQARLMLVSLDVSEGQKMRYDRLCRQFNVPMQECTAQDRLGRAAGRPGRRVVAILHAGMAEQVLGVIKAGVAE